MNNSKTLGSPQRRAFFLKSLPIIPVAAVAAAGGAATLVAGNPNYLPSVPGTPVDTALAGAANYQPTYFTAEEYRFLQAAVARLIPNDDLGPGALEAGVPEFMDRQMNTPWAAGANWYMQGPFEPNAAKEFGYQLKLNMREVFRLGIAATNVWCKKTMGKPFADLSADEQDKALTAVQKGIEDFENVPSATFFSTLWGTTKEGFFSDPIHGGNKDMVGWKLIGFPGARADFMDWIERDEKYPLPPVSIKGLRG
ncbi:MAG: gluconate 2-dehydrogenase subunit 3 family protein [Comamonas sp.]